MQSTAYYRPGQAGATQSPFVVPPLGAGGDFGSLLARQLSMRERMAALQMAAMQQEMDVAKRAAQREEEMFNRMRLGMDKPRDLGGFSNVKPGTQSYEKLKEQAENLKAYGMAKVIHQPTGKPLSTTHEAIQAIGVPAAWQGLMQSGQLFAQPSSGAVPATAAGAMMEAMGTSPPMQSPTAAGGAYAPGGMGAYRWMPGMIGGRSAEEGGRVPRTGTYKLHKNEVVIPKSVADVLWPYSGPSRPKASGAKAKAVGKYPPDYELRERARPKSKPIKSYQQGTGVVPNWWDIPGPTPRTREEGTLGELLMAVFGGDTKPDDKSTILSRLAVLDAVRRAGTPPLPTDPNQLFGPVPATEPPGVSMGAPVPMPGAAQPPAPPGQLSITKVGPGRGGPTQFGAPGQLGMATGETVRRTSPQRPEVSRLKQLQTESDKYRQSAQYQQAKARALQTYKDQRGNVPPEVQNMIRDREKSAKFWIDQAEGLKEEITRLEQQEALSKVAAFEAQGNIMEAGIRAQTKGVESRNRKLESLHDELMAANENITNIFTKKDVDEDMIASTVMQSLAPFMPYFAEMNNDTAEGSINKFMNWATMMGEGDEKATGAILASIGALSTAIRRGRFGPMGD